MTDLFFYPKFSANSPKEFFRNISVHLASKLDCSSNDLNDQLTELNKADASAIGGGVAIPQGRMKNLNRPIFAIATLKRSILFDAPDNVPVDLVWAVLSPQFSISAHLGRLANISRLLKNTHLCDQIRGCADQDSFNALMADLQAQHAIAA